MGGVSVGSFKVKLVVYFLLLSLLPLAAAFWGFTAVAGQNETRKVDTRIQTGMRSVLASYQERMRQAQSDARAVAKTSAVQNALRAGDLQPLSHLFRDNGDVSISTPDGELIGRVPQLSASRHVTIKTRSGVLGYVTVSVPFDTSLVDRLRRHSGLQSEDTLAIVAGGEIVASSPTVDGALQSPTGQPRKVTVGGTKYRALVEPALSDDPGMQFAVLRPQSLIDAANDSSRNRLLLGLIASLTLVSLVAYFEGRSIVRTLRSLAEAAHGIARGRLHERVPVRGRDEFALLGSAFNEMANQLEARLAELDEERGRLRDAITRFGEALSATHDTDQLLRVIVEAAVEATGAAGAELLADDGRFVDSGDPDADGVRLEFPLTAGRSAFGTLTIVGDSFDAEQRMAASSLASHATIALENARLHRIVERQALVDGLTGIANRRQCEDSLTSEIAQADRLGTPLTLVLADLDDFKAVNDLHGHAVGDDVLREFASVLRSTLRESDLAGRWGGEEFLLLLPGADAEGGVQLADRVRAALTERSFLGRDGQVVNVTCSFGVAQHRPGGAERDLFAAADQALYRAKRSGKNRVEHDAPVRSF
ncbi:MAG TPA: diguanylate cyclase [Gaiellaceae bacterium]|nr:diguanylate cyclase [Gaiellaceae bacterium]